MYTYPRKNLSITKLFNYPGSCDAALNATSFEVVDFSAQPDSDIPPYAILFHTWGKEEVSFQDIQGTTWKKLPGFSKIKGCCAQASNDEYKNAEVCYVYLSDVPSPNPYLNKVAFKVARWFERGWCLQELVAPRELEFYASNWTEIGTKSSLRKAMTNITGVPISVLMQEKVPSDFLAAERMSWASERTTTRIEDMAYYLFGIFDVHMPLVYGEGNKAMISLQEEILKRNDDLSLLLWQVPPWKSITMHETFGFLCDSPKYFPLKGLTSQSKDLLPYSELELKRNLASTPMESTARGLRTEMSIITHGQASYQLGWTFFKHKGEYVCLAISDNVSGTYSSARMHAHIVFTVSDVQNQLTKQVYLLSFHNFSLQGYFDNSISFNLHLHVTKKIDISILGCYPPHELYSTGGGTYGSNIEFADDKMYALLICINKGGNLWNESAKPLRSLFSTRPVGRENVSFGIFDISLEQLELDTRLVEHGDDASDRAMFSLPSGSRVSAAVKIRQNRYLAHISVLPPPARGNLGAR